MTHLCPTCGQVRRVPTRFAKPSAHEIKRFNKHVILDEFTDCWLWTGATTHGYGQWAFGGRTVYAHVFAYFMQTGFWPFGRHVCHSCDTPRCVNPAHLSAATPKKNQQDRRRKERAAIEATLNET